MVMADVIRLCQQEHSVDNYIERDAISMVEVHKALITKTNAHLRVQWRKNQWNWSREIWEKVICSDESSSTIIPHKWASACLA